MIKYQKPKCLLWLLFSPLFLCIHVAWGAWDGCKNWVRDIADVWDILNSRNR